MPKNSKNSTVDLIESLTKESTEDPAALQSLKETESATHSEYKRAHKGAADKLKIDDIIHKGKMELKKALRNYRGDEENQTIHLFDKIDRYHADTTTIKEILSIIDIMKNIVNNLHDKVDQTKNPYALLRSSNLLKVLEPIYQQMSKHQASLEKSRFDNNHYANAKKAYEEARSEYRKAYRKHNGSTLFSNPPPSSDTPKTQADSGNQKKIK